MSKRIGRARKIMRNAFVKDRDFYYGYKANVAVILMDELDIMDMEKRNRIAEMILHKIFGMESIQPSKPWPRK